MSPRLAHALAPLSLIGLLAGAAVAQSQPQASPPTEAVLAKATPQMKTVLDALKTLGPKPIESLPAPLARLQPSAADAVIQVTQDKGIVAPDKLPPVGKVEMKTVPRPDGSLIPVRVYTPKGTGPSSVLVYYHGGGWVIATLDTYDSSCRGLCSLNDAVVVSVDYRQAPEHKFPAAAEDSYAALQYVASNAGEFGGDPKKVAVVGRARSRPSPA